MRVLENRVPSQLETVKQDKKREDEMLKSLPNGGVALSPITLSPPPKLEVEITQFKGEPLPSTFSEWTQDDKSECPSSSQVTITLPSQF
jgi:hypothetical protein